MEVQFYERLDIYSLEFCFKLELKSSKINEYVFICETKEDLGGWVIALDALVSNSISNSFNTFVKPLSDKVLQTFQISITSISETYIKNAVQR